MTEDREQDKKTLGEKSLRERLEQMPVGKIAWLIIKLIGMLLLALLKYLLRLFLKGIRYVYRGGRTACRRARVFWNSNSTQEKVRKIRICMRLWIRMSSRALVSTGRWAWKWMRKGLRLSLKALVRCSVFLWVFLLRMGKALFNAILHLGPTLRRMLVYLVRCYHLMIEGIWYLCRVSRLRHLKNKRNWRRFQRNGGLKGMMIRTAGRLRSSVNWFMSEDDEETDESEDYGDDVVKEDDIASLVTPDENDSKAAQLGKKFFSGIKDIIDDDH